MLLDPENIGIVVGILLLSRIQAQIYVISYTLPVTGWFTTYPDVESIHTSLTVFLDFKNGGFRRKLAHDTNEMCLIRIVRSYLHLRRVLHFLSSLILTSHTRDFSLSVQDVILDNLSSGWITSCLHN